MRGKLAKRIRRTIRNKYKFLSDENLYVRRPDGVLMLAQQCKRALYQATKRTIKRRKQYGYS